VIAEPVLVSCLRRYWGLAGAQVSVHNGGMGSQTWFVDLGDCRWLAKAPVQANYFAWRIAGNNLTGISGPQENEKGLDDARLLLTS
jgi:hypothetical protein